MLAYNLEQEKYTKDFKIQNSSWKRKHALDTVKQNAGLLAKYMELFVSWILIISF